MDSPPNLNIGALVLEQARAHPERRALVVPRRWDERQVTEAEQLTFGELAQRIDAFRTGLERAKLAPDRRVVVLVPATADLFALLLGLAASGSAAVLIDAALPPRRLLQAIARSGADAIVSVHKLLARWPLLPPLWRLRRFGVDGSSFGVASIHALCGPPGAPGEALARGPEDEALISFTSGTTGRPKGVARPHGILWAQHLALRDLVGHDPEAVDMPCFPVLALQDLCVGTTAVLPPVDLRAPGTARGAVVADAIRRYGVTALAAAPAFLGRLAAHASRQPMASITRLIAGGAPVTRRLGRQLLTAFPEARADVVYGSSEAEPIAAASLDEAVRAEGDGFLVGRTVSPAEAVRVRAAEVPRSIGAEGIGRYAAAADAPGEVLVRGPHVARRYVGAPVDEARTKVPDADGTTWHRTGDVARQDAAGRLWLTGRTSDLVTHRGRTLEPLAIEAVLRDLPSVAQAAVVAHRGAPEGEVCLELEAGAEAGAGGAAAQSALGAMDLGTLPLKVVAAIPVDGRHNSKVDRAALREARERGRA